jgi:hypothetical protein
MLAARLARADAPPPTAPPPSVAAPGATLPERILLRYRSAPGCPREPAFRAEFRARTARAVLVGDAEAGGRIFVVTVSGEGGRIAGRVELTRADGSTAMREVSGQNCSEVVSALSLIAALSVDPQATAGPVSRADEEGAEPPRATASLGAASGAPAPNLAEARRPETASEAANDGSPRGTPPTVDATPWRFGAGAQGGMVSGILPGVAFAATGFVEAKRRADSLFAATFRLSATGSVSGSIEAERGRARFQWGALAFQGCPLSLPMGRSIHGIPCVLAEGGLLAGQGSGVSQPAGGTRRWLALGALLRVQWTPSERFFIEMEGGVRAPLERPRFVFDLGGRTEEVNRVRALGGEMSLGLGLSMP